MFACLLAVQYDTYNIALDTVYLWTVTYYVLSKTIVLCEIVDILYKIGLRYVYHVKRHAIYSIISLFSHLLGNRLSMKTIIMQM